MKKLITLAALTICIAVNATAGPVIVPKAVRETLLLNFPNISDVSWEKMESGALKATFMQNEKEINVYFTTKGELKRLDVETRWVDLPVDARMYITKKYKKAHIDSMMQNQDASAEAIYIVEVRKRNKSNKLYFSKTGELVFSRDLN